MRMIRFTSLALAGVVAAVLVAPAPVAAQGGDNPKVEIKPTNKAKRDKYVITADELAEHPDLTTGYEAVKVLRNQWLRITRASGGALGSSTTRAGDRPPPGGCRIGSTDPYCASKPPDQGGTGGSSGPVPTERGSPYAESGASTDSPGQAAPVLYLDEVKQENLDQLKNLHSTEIFEMRFLTGNQAVGRYGAGHENGAIMVKTMKFGKG